MLDNQSGEVTSTGIAQLDEQALVQYTPMAPAEVEELIVVLSARLEAAIPVIRDLWQKRYDAEAKLIEEHAKAIMSSDRRSITEKKAEADMAVIAYRHEFNNAKAILHAAEALQKALTAKLYGMLNLNKAMTASMFGQTRQ